MDFGFNGWGLKYPADRDNLFAKLYMMTHNSLMRMFSTSRSVIISWRGCCGGNGAGVILTTECVVNEANRNPWTY